MTTSEQPGELVLVSGLSRRTLSYSHLTTDTSTSAGSPVQGSEESKKKNQTLSSKTPARCTSNIILCHTNPHQTNQLLNKTNEL